MKLSELFRTAAKRVFDCIGAGIGLVVIAPVFAALWLAVRIKLGSPVIFAQQRPGKNGQLFTMLKFRSMLEEDPARNLVTDDQRSTAFGRRLRATSLDELPTLINVLKGDMSLVGPRPLVVEYLPLYSKHQARRHEVRPGITGLAQVSGRNQLSWEDRFNLDVDYVGRHNLVLDLKILAQTFGRVFSKSGIEADGISTMTMFVGPPPEDGLLEQLMSDRWYRLGQTWLQDPRAVTISVLTTQQSVGARQWMYLHDEQTPVAVCGLFGLGSPQLSASLLINPQYQNQQLVDALLKRLIHHGKSFDAQRLTLRLPAKHGVLHRNVERLGFVASTNSLNSANGTETSGSEYALVIAAEKVA